MNKRISRELLIQQLESVGPGLSPKDVVEQSSCYVFHEGRVMTFNDEIACSRECELNGLEGAVHAEALLAILHKLPEEELQVTTTDSELVIKGNRRECTIVREAEISMPISEIELPEKWRKLPEGFVEAVEMVQHCALSDDSQFMMTCVHITDAFIEACDNSQMCRVKLETGIKEAILVRHNSIKHIAALGMKKFAETESWIHFKNDDELMLSCRRFVDDYRDLNKFLKIKGAKITLPKGLGDAADRAAVFVQASPDEDQVQVTVEMKTGWLRVKGKGLSGSYKEFKKLAYDGPEIAFMIAPQLLIDITKRYNDAEISTGTLRVLGENWTYVTCLAPVEDVTKREQKSEEPEEESAE